MITAFFHDAPLIQDNNGQVYSVGFTYNLWERYLEVFDSIIVSTRMRIDNSGYGSMTKNMKLSSGPKVEFKPITRYRKNIDRILRKKDITMQIRTTLEKCDCAIIRLPSYIGYIASEQAEKMNKPYLIELVGCPWDAYWNHSLKGKLIAFPSYYKTKRININSPYVVYVTSKFLQNRYPTKGKNINCSNVALTEFDDSTLKNRLDKINDMNKENKIIIGTTAAVDVRYKGQQYVIQALGKLKKKGIVNLEYQLIGGGNQEYLRSVCKRYDVIDQVKFLGSVPHDKVINWLDNIDLYIQPSLTEGLPRALIEAMSRAVPSIGSNAGGIPELIDNVCIVDNISKNIDKISMILESINKGFMETQAKRNFEESKQYNREKIENRRKDFFVDFKEYVKDNKDY